jgi:O-methyltransferase
MSGRAGALYLDLMEAVLTRSLFRDEEIRDVHPTGWKRLVVKAITRRGYRVVQSSVARDWHFEGRHWPRTAETMVGLKRLRNIRECVEKVLEDEVPGDLIETGVWRGGACIYMRAILAAHEIDDRTVWVADSFEGLPPPTLPQDEGLRLHERSELAVGVDEVRSNFERYGLLDEQVRFLVGWFTDTLPGPVTQIAVLRLDGDLYKSTWDAMAALEPLVAPGGFVIVDDYGAIRACREAVHDYRIEHGITTPVSEIDHSGIFWRKPGC